MKKYLSILCAGLLLFLTASPAFAAVVAKPTTPISVTGDTLWPSPGAIAPLTEGSGNTVEQVHTLTSSFVAANGGIANPTWTTDSAVGGNCFIFQNGVTTGSVPGTDNEIHFANIGATASNSSNGITSFGIYKNTGDSNFVGGIIAAGCSSGDCGAGIFGGATPRPGWVIGGSRYGPTTGASIGVGDTVGVVCTMDNSGSGNLVVACYDYTTSTRFTDYTFAIGNGVSAFIGGTTDFTINPRVSALTFCLRGEVSNAGYYQGVWNSTQINAYFADPWEAVRATVSLSPSSLSGSSSASSVVVTSNTARYTAGTPGSPTFTDTGLAGSSISSQVVNSTTQATLQVIPGLTSGTAVIGDTTTTANLVVSAAAATTLTLTGPSTGTTLTPTSNYTISTNGILSTSEVLTPTSSVGGDTFTPSSVTLTTGTQSQTFTMTGSATGARNINATRTSGPVLTGPSNVVTTLSAGALVSGAVTLGPINYTSIGFTLATPTGGAGTYGPVKLYRSTTSGFTPGSGNLVQTISSPTFPLAISDTGLTKGTAYFYVIETDDSNGDTIQTAQIGAATYPIWSIGYGQVGQSHTGFMPDPKPFMTGGLTDPGIVPAWITSNNGISGSKTADWVVGQTNYNNAITAMNTAFTGHSLNQIYVRLEFGVNDAVNSVTASTFSSNISNMIAGFSASNAVVTGQSAKILLCGGIPAQTPAGMSTAQLDLMRQYNAAMKLLADNVTTFYMGDDWFDWCLNNQSYYRAGGVHLTINTDTPTPPQNTYGYNILEFIEAEMFHRTFYGVGVPGSGGGNGAFSYGGAN
jgi:hypothetical protein